MSGVTSTPADHELVPLADALLVVDVTRVAAGRLKVRFVVDGELDPRGGGRSRLYGRIIESGPSPQVTRDRLARLLERFARELRSPDHLDAGLP